MTERKFKFVIGPQQRYLHWLKTTRGLGGVRIIHVGGPEDAQKLQGFCVPRDQRENILVDLTEGDPAYRNLLAYAESLFTR